MVINLALTHKKKQQMIIIVHNIKTYKLPRLEATDMSIIRSALTANVVYGLPNVRDYIHKNRDKLMEERRQRIFANSSAGNGHLFDLDDVAEENEAED